MRLLIVTLAVLVVGYGLAALINMGLVLWFFYQRILGPGWFLVALEISIITATSVVLGHFLTKLFKLNKLLPIYLLLAAITAVMGLNIYLNNSLEPLWYKLIYLACVIPGIYFGALRAIPARPGG